MKYILFILTFLLLFHTTLYAAEQWNYVLAIPYLNDWKISQGTAETKIEGDKIHINMIDSTTRKKMDIKGELKGDNIIKAEIKPNLTMHNLLFEGIKSVYCGQTVEGIEMPCTEAITLKNEYGFFIGLTRKK